MWTTTKDHDKFSRSNSITINQKLYNTTHQTKIIFREKTRYLCKNFSSSQRVSFYILKMTWMWRFLTPDFVITMHCEIMINSGPSVISNNYQSVFIMHRMCQRWQPLLNNKHIVFKRQLIANKFLFNLGHFLFKRTCNVERKNKQNNNQQKYKWIIDRWKIFNTGQIQFLLTRTWPWFFDRWFMLFWRRCGSCN